MPITFYIPYLTPGLNGPDGLMREHKYIGKVKKRKQDLYYLLRDQKNKMKLLKINEPVKVTFIRYCLQYMDWDNACASFKHIGDALVKSNVLSDDNPGIIQDFVPKQVKVKHQKEQRIEVIIEKADAG